MKAPCEECLKQAICLSKMMVTCKDLAMWLTGPHGRVERIIYFENDIWNKDISTINSANGNVRFKDTIRDHYSALIVR